MPRTKARLVDRQVRWPWQKKQQAEEGEGGDDITNSPVFLQKKVGVLQNELKQLDVDIAAAEAKKQENWDEWGSQIENMRNEFAAVKKRTQEARTRAEAVERAGVLDQLLGPIDNFDRAIVAQKTRADASEGVQKVVDRYTGPVLRGNQIYIAASTFTPSTRHLLDGVAVSVPHRSTEPARPRHRRVKLSCTRHTG